MSSSAAPSATTSRGGGGGGNGFAANTASRVGCIQEYHLDPELAQEVTIKNPPRLRMIYEHAIDPVSGVHEELCLFVPDFIYICSAKGFCQLNHKQCLNFVNWYNKALAIMGYLANETQRDKNDIHVSFEVIFHRHQVRRRIGYRYRILNRGPRSSKFVHQLELLLASNEAKTELNKHNPFTASRGGSSKSSHKNNAKVDSISVLASTQLELLDQLTRQSYAELCSWMMYTSYAFSSIGTKALSNAEHPLHPEKVFSFARSCDHMRTHRPVHGHRLRRSYIDPNDNTICTFPFPHDTYRVHNQDVCISRLFKFQFPFYTVPRMPNDPDWDYYKTMHTNPQIEAIRKEKAIQMSNAKVSRRLRRMSRNTSRRESQSSSFSATQTSASQQPMPSLESPSQPDANEIFGVTIECDDGDGDDDDDDSDKDDEPIPANVYDFIPQNTQQYDCASQDNTLDNLRKNVHTHRDRMKQQLSEALEDHYGVPETKEEKLKHDMLVHKKYNEEWRKERIALIPSLDEIFSETGAVGNAMRSICKWRDAYLHQRQKQLDTDRAHNPELRNDTSASDEEGEPRVRRIRNGSPVSPSSHVQRANFCMPHRKKYNNLSRHQSRICTQMAALEVAHDALSTHQHVYLGYLCTLTLYDMAEYHPSILNLGAGATSKSFMQNTLAKLLIPETFIKVGTITAKSFTSDGYARDCSVVLLDEVSDSLLRGGAATTQNADAIATLKLMLTSKEFTSLRSTVVEGKSHTVTSRTTQCICVIGNSNLSKAAIDAAFLTRTIPMLYEKHSRASRLPADAMQASKNPEKAKLIEHMVERTRRDQWAVSYVSALIYTGLMEDVDMTAIDNLLLHIAEHASTHNVPHLDAVRKHENIGQLVRVTTILRAVNTLFDCEASPLYDRDWDNAQMLMIEKYLVAMPEDLVFVLGLLQQQFSDPMQQKVTGELFSRIERLHNDLSVTVTVHNPPPVDPHHAESGPHMPPISTRVMGRNPLQTRRVFNRNNIPVAVFEHSNIHIDADGYCWFPMVRAGGNGISSSATVTQNHIYAQSQHTLVAAFANDVHQSMQNRVELAPVRSAMTKMTTDHVAQYKRYPPGSEKFGPEWEIVCKRALSTEARMKTITTSEQQEMEQLAAASIATMNTNSSANLDTETIQRQQVDDMRQAATRVVVTDMEYAQAKANARAAAEAHARMKDEEWFAPSDRDNPNAKKNVGMSVHTTHARVALQYFADANNDALKSFVSSVMNDAYPTPRPAHRMLFGQPMSTCPALCDFIDIEARSYQSTENTFFAMRQSGFLPVHIQESAMHEINDGTIAINDPNYIDSTRSIPRNSHVRIDGNFIDFALLSRMNALAITPEHAREYPSWNPIEAGRQIASAEQSPNAITRPELRVNEYPSFHREYASVACAEPTYDSMKDKNAQLQRNCETMASLEWPIPTACITVNSSRNALNHATPSKRISNKKRMRQPEFIAPIAACTTENDDYDQSSPSSSVMMPPPPARRQFRNLAWQNTHSSMSANSH